IVMFWQAMSIPVSPLYAKVGPTVVPMMTAAALGMLGVLLLIDAWQGGWQTEEEKSATPDRAALLWIFAGLVLHVVLIGPAAFTTVRCTAARPRRFCSTRRARAPPSSRRSRVTKWRVMAAPARRSRPRPSARSSLA